MFCTIISALWTFAPATNKSENVLFVSTLTKTAFEYAFTDKSYSTKIIFCFVACSVSSFIPLSLQQEHLAIANCTNCWGNGGTRKTWGPVCLVLFSIGVPELRVGRIKRSRRNWIFFPSWPNELSTSGLFQNYPNYQDKDLHRPAKRHQAVM